MAEKSFSSRSSFRSIIFMLLAFLAIPFPVLAQNNEITLSLGGIPSQSRPTTGERSVRSALRRCREVLVQARRRVSVCLFALVRLLG